VTGDLNARRTRRTSATVAIKTESLEPSARIAPAKASNRAAEPALRRGFVRRPAIVNRLLGAADASLALIVAPAGYGKSTLLAEWATSDERPFVWVTFTPRTRDVATVASSISEAFAGIGWVDTGAPARVSREAGGELAALESLMCFLDRGGRRFVLVLDDAHNTQARVVKPVVSALLDRIGSGSQIALATRVEPPLPIGRLRAHRRLVEVRTDDLAMVPAEAAALLKMAGLELEFGAVQALSVQTEGWPAGLYLAALSLRDEDDMVAGIKEFDGDHRLVADYFRDELLTGLSPKLKRFLIHSSVLDDLSGPICDAVLESSGSAAALTELERAQRMLVALDHSQERYRCHGLFRAMLRAELRRSDPDLEQRLHERASRWLEGRGDADGAISHAVAAGNAGLTGRLLWESLADYLALGRLRLVRGWLDRFDAGQIADSAPLAAAAALTCLMSGDVDEAWHWRLLASEAERRGHPAESTASLQTALRIIDAVSARRGAAAMASSAARAYSQEPAHSPWRPVCCLLRGVAEYLSGDSDGARRHLQEGAEAGAARSPAVTALCLAQLSTIAVEQDDWETGHELAESARQIASESQLDDFPLLALVFAASAATRAHRGQADEAKLDLRRAANLLTELGDLIPWYGAQIRLVLERAAVGLADTVRARTLLAEASRLARRTPDAVVFQAALDRAWAEIDSLAETALSGPSSLTIAELRILRFLPSHRSFREIAERLDVSINTVKTQAHAIYRKLDAASRSEAVARASEAGLLGS
jgi:LuxR family transcriptional regulator, maltose regulon positive regulatory protein